jgi:hypothetical protein
LFALKQNLLKNKSQMYSGDKSFAILAAQNNDVRN